MDFGILADTNSGVYKFTKVLHILVAIIGIGTVFLNGIYGQVSKRKGESGAAAESAGISEANEKVASVAERFFYLIPAFGVGLVFMSDDVWEFDQTWIVLSILFYAAALTVSLTVVQPTARKIVTVTRELADMGPPRADAAGPPPQVATLDALGRRIGASSGFAHLTAVSILFLMIWKPGR